MYWKVFGRVSQNPTPGSQDLEKKVFTLAHYFWGPHGLPPVSLSQHSVQSSFSLYINRISLLINSHGSNMTGCLNPRLTEHCKSCACNSLTEIPIPASWKRESGGLSGSQLWPEEWVLWLVPNEQQLWK